MAIFLNTDILQGSVATRSGCGEVFVYDFITNFLLSLSEKILKIDQYLVKLRARVRCLVFLTHSVESFNYLHVCRKTGNHLRVSKYYSKQYT